MGVAVAALLVIRQLRTQPVNANFRLPLILGIIGLIQLTNYLQRPHRQHRHRGPGRQPGAGGRARRGAGPTVQLWMQGGQPWRKGTWLTGVLWVVSPWPRISAWTT